jgi:alpha-tubulin suppressor-like RCC1 family protein
MFTLVRREFTAALASCAIAAAIAVPGSAAAAAPAPNTSPPATVSLLAAGDNGYGALGTGDNTSSSTALPVQVPGVVITHAAAGTYHSVGVTEDGAAFDWGRGANGALGNGLTADSNTPVRVVLPVAARDVAAGDGFSLALTTDGRVFAWGDDEFGQLGNGTIDTGSSTPVPVAFPAGVTVAQISAGEDFALARDTSGVVYAWGDNANGQLGDGTTTTRTAPVPVPLPDGVSALQVAAGSTDGYAVTTANRVLA